MHYYLMLGGVWWFDLGGVWVGVGSVCVVWVGFGLVVCGVGFWGWI